MKAIWMGINITAAARQKKTNDLEKIYKNTFLLHLKGKVHKFNPGEIRKRGSVPYLRWKKKRKSIPGGKKIRSLLHL